VKVKKLTNISIAIDANEANVQNRVGSNVYAFEILKQLEQLTRNTNKYNVTVLLANKPLADLPIRRPGWEYKVLKPKKFWTQWALPIHLYFNSKKYNVLFTPGHYAPRVSKVPYVSSIMDLAYLEFPTQFKKSDLVQLTDWTKYSVQNAKKVVTISEFSKQEIIKHYNKKVTDIIVAYPNIGSNGKPCLVSRQKAFFRKHKIKEPYILYMGTIQPRKNLINLIESFEIFSRGLATGKYKKKRGKKRQSIQLVIAGKVGWLAKDIFDRAEKSPFQKRIIFTDYVPDELKASLYKKALATTLVGLYEGFGIPPLESLHFNTIPVVSQTSSLPEVVDNAGILVDPSNPKSIADGLAEVYSLTVRQKAIYRKRARLQVKKFDWQKSAKKILNSLEEIS